MLHSIGLCSKNGTRFNMEMVGSKSILNIALQQAPGIVVVYSGTAPKFWGAQYCVTSFLVGLSANHHARTVFHIATTIYSSIICVVCRNAMN